MEDLMYCDHDGEACQWVSCDTCRFTICTDCAIAQDGGKFLCPDCKASACPNCGEIGGTPVVTHYHEFQGCWEHGGFVEFEEARCSKCVRQAVAA